MQLLKRILDKLNGLHFRQEYLCLAKEGFDNCLLVYLVDETRVLKDITGDHLFVGYSPLVFVLHERKDNHDADNAYPACIDLIFTQQRLEPNGSFKRKDALARLRLNRFKIIEAEGQVLFFYEGVKGAHHFISGFHQMMMDLKNKLYNRKTGNVFLKGNLYKQVQIAYSVPRIISTITVGQNGKFNLFPTDLHGLVNEKIYVGSLRHGGNACRQVEEARKILITQIHVQDYKKVYSLGKNHMQDVKARESFGFGETLSKIYHLPYLPSGLLYRELELKESFDIGIHRLLLFKIASEVRLSGEPATLAHIHNCYATWRSNNGLGGNYLLR